MTRELIVQRALDLVDREGMAALSMRRLAQTLDVDPMSIYHHMPDKAAVVSGMVDRVFTEMALPQPASDDDWQEQVRAWVRAYRDLTRRHPNLVLQIVTDATAVTRAAEIIGSPLHEALRVSGTPERQIPVAAAMFVDWVNGYALAGVEDGAAFDEALELMLLGVAAVAR